MCCETVPLHTPVHGAGSRVVPAVDPLAAAHVQAGGQAQSQVHSHAQADAGDGLQGMGT